MLKKLRKLVADFDQVAAELHEWVNSPLPGPKKACHVCGDTECRWAEQ